MAKAVKAAFMANMRIFFIKLIAAFVTGSAGMAAEAAHSLVDTGNQLVLMRGMKRSKRKPDAMHPFGHGKEEYLSSLSVASLIFIGGSLYSAYEGIHKLMHPEPLKYAYLGLLIFGVSAYEEGKSWLIAKHELGCESLREMYKIIVDSKDLNTVVVFVEDTGALLGLGVAFLGTLLSMVTGNSSCDAFASLMIAIILLVFSWFLRSECNKLIVGEAIDSEDIQTIKDIVNSHADVKLVGEVKTMQLGTESCIVGVEVDFRNDLSEGELEKIIPEIEEDILEEVPEAEGNIYIKVKDLD